jgi:hypothetical protein
MDFKFLKVAIQFIFQLDMIFIFLIIICFIWNNL